MKTIKGPGGLECFWSDLSKHPACPHGPALLFGRYTDGELKQFYVCSACRDRKLCTFYNDKETTSPEVRKKNSNTITKKPTPTHNHRKLYIRYNELTAQNPDRRAYCHNCEKLLAFAERPKHADHNVQTDLSDEEMNNPTRILKPLANVKKEAQYLFSEKTTIDITNMLVKAGARQVLCIGAPKIHEYISQKLDNKISSLLLDFDERFYNFFGPLSYCHYNLFNHHFFTEEGAENYRDFMMQNGGKYTFVICDPPFGGRVEAISQTIKTIEEEHAEWNENIGDNNCLKILFVFPYFMESIIQRKSNPPEISGGLRDLAMADYKVDYDNHPLFVTGSNGRKHGSPVRIFTNIPLNSLELPVADGYKYCGKCKKWISQENKHCKICKSCTSKDGRRYRHCKICQRCVKPTWKHCETCDRCNLEKHACGVKPKITGRCLNCGDPDHTVKDCTNLIDTSDKSSKKVTTKKRKSITNVISTVPKKRKSLISTELPTVIETANSLKVKKMKNKTMSVEKMTKKLERKDKRPEKLDGEKKKVKASKRLKIPTELPTAIETENSLKVKKIKNKTMSVEKTTKKLERKDKRPEKLDDEKKKVKATKRLKRPTKIIKKKSNRLQS